MDATMSANGLSHSLPSEESTASLQAWGRNRSVRLWGRQRYPGSLLRRRQPVPAMTGGLQRAPLTRADPAPAGGEQAQRCSGTHGENYRRSAWLVFPGGL